MYHLRGMSKAHMRTQTQTQAHTDTHTHICMHTLRFQVEPARVSYANTRFVLVSGKGEWGERAGRAGKIGEQFYAARLTSFPCIVVFQFVPLPLAG